VVAEPVAARMSVEEYLEAEKAGEFKHEFVDGWTYLMAGGTLAHSELAVSAVSILRNLLRGSSCRVYNSDAQVKVSPTRFFYPDATVGCDPRDRPAALEILYPKVILEVLSESTEAFDRGAKFRYYRACPSLEEYILVNTREPLVELYRRAGNFWAYATFSPGETVELASLAVTFQVDDLYEGIELPVEEGEPGSESGASQ
jgi:Uma2 family endonuclease